MTRSSDRLEELLNLMQKVDLSTLLGLDRRLHLLLEQKGKDPGERDRTTSVREEFRIRYPGIAVDLDLFALVGIHPQNPLEEDKSLIRNSISRTFTD